MGICGPHSVPATFIVTFFSGSFLYKVDFFLNLTYDLLEKMNEISYDMYFVNTGNQQNPVISFNCLVLFTILWPLLLGNFSKDNSFLQLHSVPISLEVLSAKYEYYLIFCRFNLLLLCIMETIVL